MTILHGDNTTASRAQLMNLLETARAEGREIIRLEGKKITAALLQDVVGSTSLFGQPKLIIIEEAHSLPKSTKKEVLLDLIATLASQLEDSTQLILWEKRPLTATMLKRFGPAQTFEFKVSNALFKWLESLSPQPKTKAAQLKLLHQALANDDSFMCLAMLIRQVRLLLQAKDGGALKGAPFMITKLKHQAQTFTLDQLLKLHAQLLKIDLEEKSSDRSLSLDQKLDLLVIEL